MKLRNGVLTAVAAATAIALTATPATAIVDGTDDTTNRYANVGALQVRVDEDPDEWAIFCSGTLIEPDVVLTAAHCLDFFDAEVGEEGFGPDDLRVSFDVAPDEDSTYYGAERIVVNPDWFLQPGGAGNSKHLYLAPPAEDIALIFLEEEVAGVTPATVAEEGYLDTLDVRDETFTVVGYGTDAFVTGSAGSPRAVTIFDGVRSYRDVSAIPARDAFPDRFIKVTAGVCFGDSGGPLFHGDVLVALNTWTFSYRCDGPNLEYRVDSAVAQEFLDTYL